jgi:hypothetical protein
METIITALSWPCVVLILGTIFLIIFRKPLNSFIARITSIDKSGIKALQTPEVQREEQKKEVVQQLLLAIGDTIVLRDVEGHITSDLQQKGLETAGDTVKILVKRLAATTILLEFEQIYNLIFGSQIFLLKKLNEVAGQGKASDLIRDYFKRVQNLFPESFNNWSLEQYLEFLINRSLITTRGNIYHITNLGVEYLTWMVRNGKGDERPL